MYAKANKLQVIWMSDGHTDVEKCRGVRMEKRRYGMGKGVRMCMACRQHRVDVDLDVILYSRLVTPVFHGSEIDRKSVV